MNRRFLLGQYRVSNSFGHRLDPRTKVIFALALMILSLFTTALLFYLAIIAVLVALLFMSDISLSLMARNFRPFLILISLTALYHLLFSARDSLPLATFWGFRLTQGGVYMAASFSLRVIEFVAIAFFITFTTAPSDLAEALVGWLKPFRKLGVPVEDITLIIFIAMRFIPVLAEEFDTIRKAQMMRGVNFGGGLIKRARSFGYLLIPVLQSALRRADELALAIESRGYISGAPRSHYRQFLMTSRDWVFLSAGLISMFILFWLLGGKS